MRQDELPVFPLNFPVVVDIKGGKSGIFTFLTSQEP